MELILLHIIPKVRDLPDEMAVFARLFRNTGLCNLNAYLSPRGCFSSVEPYIDNLWNGVHIHIHLEEIFQFNLV